MTLLELITAVKEKNLSKDALEAYRDQLSGLFAQMQLELADIEKKKAIFFDNSTKLYQEMNGKSPSDISVKRLWQAMKEGQREIELKRYAMACKEMLNSLKSRLYSIY